MSSSGVRSPAGVIIAVAMLSLAAAQERDALPRDVPGIDTGRYRVGNLYLLSPDAVPVAVGIKNREELKYGVGIAAVSLGKGRVVAFGGAAFFDPKFLDRGDNGEVLLQVLRWAAGEGKVAVPGKAKLAEWLSKRGVDAGGESMEGAPGLIVVPKKTDAAGLKEFVLRGGGLLVSLSESRLAEFAGIVAGGPWDRAGDLHEVVKAPAWLNAHEAIKVLREVQGGKNVLGKAEAFAAVRHVEGVYRWADPHLKPLLDGIEKTVELPKGNVAWKRPLERIRLTWSNWLEMRRPVEEIRKDPAADLFPGPVTKEAPRESRTVTVDLQVPFWHSTGLYAPSGEKVSVEIPEARVGLGLKVRIGCHTDRLWHKDSLRRVPEVSNRFDLTAKKTVAANPYGGLIYIVVPGSFRGKRIDRRASFEGVEPIVNTPTPVRIRISGAVQAPSFVLGKSRVGEWRNRMRDCPVPFVEIVGEKMIWTLAAESLKDLERPDEVARFWDRVMDHAADLAGCPRRRVAPMRFVLDRQISAGAGHSGYPLMAHIDSWTRGAIDVEHVKKNGTWGHFHEIGHNHQELRGWTFQGQGEVTVNLFSLYISRQMCGWKVGSFEEIPGAKGWQTVSVRDRQRKALKEIYSADPSKPGKWEEADYGEKLIFHVLMIDAFGWDAYKKVIRSYRTHPEFPGSEEGRGGEFMIRLSLVVRRNLHPYFRGWGIKMPADAGEQVKDLSVWTPELLKGL